MAEAISEEQRPIHSEGVQHKPGTFHLFGKFPGEIQNLIWDQAALAYLESNSVIAYLLCKNYLGDSSDPEDPKSLRVATNAFRDGGFLTSMMLKPGEINEQDSDELSAERFKILGMKTGGPLTQATRDSRAAFKHMARSLDPIYEIEICEVTTSTMDEWDLEQMQEEPPLYTSVGIAARFQPNSTIMMFGDNLGSSYDKMILQMFPHTRRVLFNCSQDPFLFNEFWDTDHTSSRAVKLSSSRFVYYLQASTWGLDPCRSVQVLKPEETSEIRDQAPVKELWAKRDPRERYGSYKQWTVKIDDRRFCLDEFPVRGYEFPMVEICRCDKSGITYAWPSEDCSWRLHHTAEALMRTTLEKLQRHAPALQSISYTVYKEPRHTAEDPETDDAPEDSESDDVQADSESEDAPVEPESEDVSVDSG